MILDIDQAFNTSGYNIYDFFQRPGVGFYIPLYQREYSWDSDNVNQLLDDISKGIESLAATNGDSEDEIRFLGTIITVVQADKTKIEPIDNKGLPSSIEKVIDGQQRLTTICLIAAQLYKHIKTLRDSVSDKSEYYDEIIEACDLWLDKLLDVISLNLGKGKVKRKPQLIRGQKDKWVKDGTVDGNYNSPLANYLGHFLEYIFLDSVVTPPQINRSNNVGKNTALVEKWLNNIVTEAHINEDEEEFIPAWLIVDKISEEDIWGNARPELVQLIKDEGRANKKSLSYTCCSLVQLFAVCHYMLERCCFTHIQPTNDDWAFDMFQSLNASGTPLTAIETFKPMVHNVTEIEEGNFKNSIANKSFVKIESLFNKTNTAAKKSKLTNDFLISYRLVIDGKKLQSHFSHQRKWLDATYDGIHSYKDKTEFILLMGNYASFYETIWMQYKGENTTPLEILKSHPDSDLASLLLLYLKESNHNMSITILAWIYSDIVQGKEGSISTFVDALKAIAAFYTIWRSCQSNSGLDNVYRKYFEENSWLKNKHIDLIHFKGYLRNVLALEKYDIYQEEKWKKKALDYLRYDNARPVCKFSLFVSSHDTIPDDSQPGAMKAGTKNCSPYLKLERWNSDKLKTIEHVAPEKGSGVWDERLYGEQKQFHSIGNLTLLPAAVNTSASNKGWAEKHIYYQYLSAKDPAQFDELKNKADSQGITLSDETVDLIKNSDYNEHVAHIVKIGADGNWDLDLVKIRGDRICNILWATISPWLET